MHKTIEKITYEDLFPDTNNQPAKAEDIINNPSH